MFTTQQIQEAKKIRKEAAQKWNCAESEIYWPACVALAAQKTMSRIDKIQSAIEKFDYTTKEWKGLILILNAKGKNVGHVKSDGTIVRKREGSKQLMGALVRDAIKDVL
jgi:DNA-binding protein YbaB